MINVGLIGYGYWGPNLARNLAETDGVHLAAIADETNGFAGRYGGEEFCLLLPNFNNARALQVGELAAKGRAVQPAWEALGFEGRAQWDPAFYLYGGILMLGGVLWLFMNPRRTVVPEDAKHV